MLQKPHRPRRPRRASASAPWTRDLGVPMTPLSAPTLSAHCPLPPEDAGHLPLAAAPRTAGRSPSLAPGLPRTALARGPRGAGASSPSSQSECCFPRFRLYPFSSLLDLTSSLWLQLTETGQQLPELSPVLTTSPHLQQSLTSFFREVPGPVLVLPSRASVYHPSLSLAWEIPIAS